MSEQSAAKLSDAMKAALAGGYGNRGNDGRYRLLSQTPRRTVEALQSRGMVEGMTLTAEGVTVGAKHSPAKEFAKVVDALHTLFIDGEEIKAGLTYESVQFFADNARSKRLDWEQLADGTVRIETRHYVPQQPAPVEDAPQEVQPQQPAAPVCGHIECEKPATVEGLYYGSWSPVCHFHSYASTTRPLTEAQQQPAAVAPVDGVFYGMYVGALREGARIVATLGAANVQAAIDNANGWPVESLAGGEIRVGYSWFVPDTSEAAQDGTQERPGAVAAPDVPTGAQRGAVGVPVVEGSACGGCGAEAGERCKDALLDLLAAVGAPVSVEDDAPQARECGECGAAPGEACSPLFTCGSPLEVEPQWVSEAQQAVVADVASLPRAAREYMERAGVIAG